MSSINGALDAAKSALLTHQLAISTTGHNISNVNTEGYSRQRLETAPRLGQEYMGNRLGAGVLPLEVTRYRNEFYDYEYRREASAEGEWGVHSDQMSMIESIFGDPSSSTIANAFNDFWNAWSDLANYPEDQAMRLVLVERADSLCQSFHGVAGDLEQMRLDLNEEVRLDTSEINSLAQEIQTLNQKIFSAEVSGIQAPDLRDTRDRLLDELATLADITWEESSDGTFRVYLSGRALVDGQHRLSLETYRTVSDEVVIDSVRWSDTQDDLQLQSGSLSAKLLVRDEVIPSYQEDLDDLANALVTQVNAMHKQGYNLAGVSGMDFFEAGHTSADSMSVDTLLLANPEMVAASADGGEGNADIANAISELRDTPVNSLGGASIEEAYSRIYSRLGSETNTAEVTFEAQRDFVQEMENRRQSVMGVNLDEEMTLLLQQQQAFQAASRMVTVLDELIQTVIALGM